MRPLPKWVAQDDPGSVDGTPETTARQSRRRISPAVAALGAFALFIGPAATQAIDVTGTTGDTASQVTTTVQSTQTTVQTTTQAVQTTVQATTDTTQTAVQNTQATVQNTAAPTTSSPTSATTA